MTQNNNRNLDMAKANEKDEFYTRLEDIERELRHYRHHFKDKVVYCNCDDPRVSNFFHYFSYNFEKLGLKKLITTCYKNQHFDLFSQNDSEEAVYLEYNGEKDGGNVPTVENIGVHALKGDGDFRSKESIEILKEADIVVTNPPFSLFRDYVSQLMEYDKKFVIVGHQNALTYKDFFPLIKENKVWLGYGFKGGAGHFINKNYTNYATATDKKDGMIRVSGVVWYTNLDIPKRHEDIILYKKYTPEECPKYDNYDAINIDKVKDIPKDYEGLMGVPITFMNKYNPNQFMIEGMIKGSDAFGAKRTKKYMNPIEHKKNGEKKANNNLNAAPAIRVDSIEGLNNYFTAENADGPLRITYARLLVRNKKAEKR